jgi:NAD(P)H-dependent flavin oxidoreductase YrpB (nitropropane dioxygenase family)
MSDITGLAAAVSNAGALGMVTLTWSADAGAVVRKTAALTTRPFGGNFVLTADHHRDLDQALEAGLKIVSFMWGDSSSYIKAVHDAGGIVLHTVGSAEEARQAVASGADVIVAQGWEAGGRVWGHRALRNSTARAWDAAGRPPDSERPGAGDVIAHFASGEGIVRYEPAPPMVGTTGDIEALSLWAGQSVALAKKPQSAAEIVTELCSLL